MSAIANIVATSIISTAAGGGSRVVTSDAVIGINKTFAPVGQPVPGVFKWVDRSGGVPVGYPSYELSSRDPINGSRNYKIMQRIKFPVLEVTSGGTGSGYVAMPKVAYTIQETREIIIPEAALPADRLVFFSLIQSLSSDVVLASDFTPSDFTGSPFRDAILLLDKPY